MPLSRNQEPTIHRLRTRGELQALANEPFVYLFKHSAECGLSGSAMEEVLDFLRENSSCPVYMISVQENRDLCNLVSTTMGIRHESPQIIALSQGKPVANVSHFRVTRKWLEATCADHQKTQSGSVS